MQILPHRKSTELTSLAKSCLLTIRIIIKIRIKTKTSTATNGKSEATVQVPVPVENNLNNGHY
jgi:hypothetical protein